MKRKKKFLRGKFFSMCHRLKSHDFSVAPFTRFETLVDFFLASNLGSVTQQGGSPGVLNFGPSFIASFTLDCRICLPIVKIGGNRRA